ncbi:MAG: hypothetical protein RL095_3171, partial [Verrucomicrobiota bacterium]
MDLFKAVRDEKLNEIFKLLKSGVDVNQKDEYGKSPLHYSLSPLVTRILTEHGADINVIDRNGRTPLDYAPNTKMHEVVQSLGGRKGDIKLKPDDILYSSKFYTDNIEADKRAKAKAKIDAEQAEIKARQDAENKAAAAAAKAAAAAAKAAAAADAAAAAKAAATAKKAAAAEAKKAAKPPPPPPVKAVAKAPVKAVAKAPVKAVAKAPVKAVAKAP